MLVQKISFIVCLLLFLVIINKLGNIVFKGQHYTNNVHDLVVVGFCGLAFYLIASNLL